MKLYAPKYFEKFKCTVNLKLYIPKIKSVSEVMDVCVNLIVVIIS